MENIMINKQGEIRLIDFGYSTINNAQVNQKQRFCGTPYYFPPEFILKNPNQGEFYI
jgi:serine/threonine protein kinase